MIKLICAIDRNYGIGFNNDLLFKVSEDMTRFQELTTGHIVVMGRKTLESLPKPLKDRTNVVLTRNENYEAPVGVFKMDSVDKIVSHYLTTGEQDKHLFIIGGQEIYREFLPHADTVELTVINKEAIEVDAFFPYELLKQYFKISKAETHYSETEECVYSFVTYIKN